MTSPTDLEGRNRRVSSPPFRIIVARKVTVGSGDQVIEAAFDPDRLEVLVGPFEEPPIGGPRLRYPESTAAAVMRRVVGGEATNQFPPGEIPRGTKFGSKVAVGGVVMNRIPARTSSFGNPDGFSSEIQADFLAAIRGVANVRQFRGVIENDAKNSARIDRVAELSFAAKVHEEAPLDAKYVDVAIASVLALHRLRIFEERGILPPEFVLESGPLFYITPKPLNLLTGWTSGLRPQLEVPENFVEAFVGFANPISLERLRTKFQQTDDDGIEYGLPPRDRSNLDRMRPIPELAQHIDPFTEFLFFKGILNGRGQPFQFRLDYPEDQIR